MKPASIRQEDSGGLVIGNRTQHSARPNFQDITGKVVDYLTVKEPTKEYSYYGTVWKAVCRCEAEVKVTAAKLNHLQKLQKERLRQAPIACGECVKKWRREQKEATRASRR